MVPPNASPGPSPPGPSPPDSHNPAAADSPSVQNADSTTDLSGFEPLSRSTATPGIATPPTPPNLAQLPSWESSESETELTPGARLRTPAPTTPAGPQLFDYSSADFTPHPAAVRRQAPQEETPGNPRPGPSRAVPRILARAGIPYTRTPVPRQTASAPARGHGQQTPGSGTQQPLPEQAQPRAPIQHNKPMKRAEAREYVQRAAKDKAVAKMATYQKPKRGQH